ncbi:MAG: regulatory protein RecX [Solirubrobacteraceae bacterium]
MGPKALQLAYSYLNRRDRTAAELCAYLAAREFAEAEVEAAISELVELGYVDDARYARLFAQDKRTLEEWGEERIRRSLRERGVGQELVEAALRETAEADGADELTRALSLLRRRFPEPPADRRERDRALGVMIRKGFDSELALDALSAYARGDAAA